jgi:hypothetical protein
MFTLTILSACPQCGINTEFIYLTTGNGGRIYFCTKCCSAPDDHHMDTKKMREIVATELRRVLSRIEPINGSDQHVEYHD